MDDAIIYMLLLYYSLKRKIIIYPSRVYETKRARTRPVR